MPSESAKAQKYEQAYPGTGIPDEQKAERFDRRDVKRRRQSGHPMRITVPSHFDGFAESTKTCEWVEIAPGRFKRVPLAQ